ncbi:hypothetical protein QJS10_CPA10g01286 [Acorus calamus]|uniref:Uncharacterized protein n=1 Tax=Acorus calamus TaxID=4465 RepID=A0AAV9DXI4_ACOCL|nr:hypothetical protein QJS10_CPA10g01286 [Acorus calamus]
MGHHGGYMTGLALFISRFAGPCPVATSLCLALLFKSVTIRFIPSDPSSPILLPCDPDAVSSDLDSLLRYIQQQVGVRIRICDLPFEEGI